MDSIFMNSAISKTPDPHRLSLNFSDKIDLNCCPIKTQHILYMEIHNQSYENNRFKISGPTWNEKFELPDDSYSVSNIQGYFEYIIKIHEMFTEIPL